MRAANLLASVAMVTAISTMTTACDDGSKIDNEIMQLMYPESFRPGNPEYLERDFEAGADFICDEIEIHYGRDICAEPKIKWRG